jgi:hypothetical protein
MTASWVIAAMIRSEARRQTHGHIQSTHALQEPGQKNGLGQGPAGVGGAPGSRGGVPAVPCPGGG